MDVKLTRTEYAITDRVLKLVQDEIAERYNKIYRGFMSKHPNVSQDKISAIQKKFVEKRDAERDLSVQLIKKVSILLHFYRLNGTKQVSALEIVQQVFLEGGEDFNNIKKRKRLLDIMKYFAATQDVSLLYATTDKKGKILFVQMPEATLLGNNVKISKINLLGQGDYIKEDKGNGNWFCYLADHKEDGITLNSDNFEDYLNVIYTLNRDPDVVFEAQDYQHDGYYVFHVMEEY